MRGLRTRQALIQATLDLVQAGDVEPTSAAIATIDGVSSRALFQHFTGLADLHAAAFDLAVRRAFDRNRPVDSGAPLSSRIDLLVSDTDRSCSRNGFRYGIWFAVELGNLQPASHDLVLDSLDLAFGLDSWMNMREQLRLSPVRASRTWRFTAQAIVLQALAVPTQPAAA